LALARTLEIIEATSSRLKFIEILANYFRSVIVLSPGDLLFSVYLCLNKLAPSYEGTGFEMTKLAGKQNVIVISFTSCLPLGIELGVAETNVMKAIAQATGRALDKIKADAGQLGDLGLVAESSRSNQKTLFQPQPLMVAGVFHKLKEIASMSGQSVSSIDEVFLRSLIFYSLRVLRN
jgi:DNA ligase-1